LKVYLIGSLRNPAIPVLAAALRSAGIQEVFDDWYAAGPEADDYWQKYEKAKGHDFATALDGHAAYHVFEYDRTHLDSSDAVVLVMPAGKSGHLEFGYAVGRGIPGFILLDGEPERFDVMYRFAQQVYTADGPLIRELVNMQAAASAGF
jgi:nucleoside 2-deoxyribosyltransferase